MMEQEQREYAESLCQELTSLHPGAAITSRFLLAFVKRWDVVVARVVERNDYINKQAAYRDRVVSMIRGSSIGTHSDSHVYAPAPYGEICVSGSGVKLHFYSLPIDLAEMIIGVVEAWRKVNPEDDS